MYKKYKMVVFDLDGTLLNSNKEILESSIHAINKLSELGIFIAIATGRIHQMTTYYLQKLNFKGLLISSNGARVYDYDKNKKIFQLPLSLIDAKQAVYYCYQNKIDCSILTEETCYFSPSSQRIKVFEEFNLKARESQNDEIELKTYKSFPNVSKIEKLIMFEENIEKQKELMKYLAQCKVSTAFFSQSNLIDLVHYRVSKGLGVKKICRYLKIKLNEVVVFGDYDNDVSMLKIAGLPVVMENGSDKAKEKAKFITTSNDNHGIAKAIEKIFFEVNINEI